MPVLESTEFTTPRSALRHRPIGNDGMHQEKRPTGTDVPTPIVPRASRTRSTDTDVEINEWERVEANSEKSRQSQPPIRRSSATTEAKALPKTPLQRPTKSHRLPRAKNVMSRHAHPLLYLGIGMLGMLVLWTVLMGVANWFSTTMDDVRYGRPRTYQTDQFVGHSESGGIPSHFIALNLYGRIEVIEFPGGDAAHARIFLGPQLYTTGSDLVPATLSFRDVNGDHKPDMIINVQGSQIVFINDQGTFRPLRPDERHQVEQFLQQHGP